LDEKVALYNNPAFIDNDPVCIPHSFTSLQDIEISAFWSAILAWGQRPVIISKSRELFARMDNAPYQFVLHHQENDLKKLLDFKHRTFNTTDTLYFIQFFKDHYQKYQSLEDAFLINSKPVEGNLESHLVSFHDYFFNHPDAPQRTRKHIPTPIRKSTCKRLNMFLRWMVRKDQFGVDFGIWNRILPSQLLCPCDLHVDRVARRLGLITRKATDWEAVIELTSNLRKLDHQDPVKYDFALFGLGIIEKF